MLLELYQFWNFSLLNIVNDIGTLAKHTFKWEERQQPFDTYKAYSSHLDLIFTTRKNTILTFYFRYYSFWLFNLLRTDLSLLGFLISCWNKESFLRNIMFSSQSCWFSIFSWVTSLGTFIVFILEMDSVLVNPLRTCRDTGEPIVHTRDRSHIELCEV